MQTNPIVQLSEAIQKQTGKNIISEVIKITGVLHSPTISVEIRLPDGRVFRGTGANQKTAKQEAALKALKELNLNI